jgi:hypothetical protein
MVKSKWARDDFICSKSMRLILPFCFDDGEQPLTDGIIPKHQHAQSKLKLVVTDKELVLNRWLGHCVLLSGELLSN